MLGNITFGQYFPGDTVIHRLDPRSKIFFTLLVRGLIFAATNFPAYAVLAVFFLGAALTGGFSPVRLLRSVKPVWPIILLTFLVHIFSNQGEAVFSLWIFKGTREGLLMGLLMVTRLVFLLLFSSLLTMSTSPLELTDGLEKILSPFKKIGLPAHELAMMMTIAIRFIPTLLMETERIIMAQSARGADFKTGSLMKRARDILSLVVPLFLSAFRRADELATAMEARCYRGGEGRTRMKELALAGRDFGAACFAVFLAAAMLGVSWYLP
jgi:energy-coupling factor transport system permease protein